jgi:ApaG protein
MYEAITAQIRVRVTPQFVAEQSAPDEGRYFWAYMVEITNLGTERVQLKSRVWKITDANGRTEEVSGTGVIGQQPVLEPGKAFTYQSGCPLRTPQGLMAGSYQMAAGDGRKFDIAIPAFSLDSPYGRSRLN